MNNTLAWIRVSNELLRQALGFPEGTEIIKADAPHLVNPTEIMLLVSHPALPPVENGHIIPVANPKYQRRLTTDNIFETSMEYWGVSAGRSQPPDNG